MIGYLIGSYAQCNGRDGALLWSANCSCCPEKQTEYSVHYSTEVHSAMFDKVFRTLDPAILSARFTGLLFLFA